LDDQFVELLTEQDSAKRWCVRRGIVGEQALTERQESGTVASGEEAERADADNTARQDAEQEAA